MRFSTSALAVAALPFLASAQVDQYVAQFQNALGNLGSYIPNPGAHDPVAALEAKTGAMKMSTLTVNNWKDTLYEPVSPSATTPEQWWVLLTGGNKTCYGRCGPLEAAFNETAGKFAVLPNKPHMAVLNCDQQPILCNAWSAGTGVVWVFDMLPAPAAIDIHKRRFNLTTVTSEDLVKLEADDIREGAIKVDGYFHPFNGQVAEMGLAIPFGYVIWGFGLIPNWLFMLLVSFGSRTMMGRRMQQPGAGAGGAPAAAQ